MAPWWLRSAEDEAPIDVIEMTGDDSATESEARSSSDSGTNAAPPEDGGEKRKRSRSRSRRRRRGTPSSAAQPDATQPSAAQPSAAQPDAAQSGAAQPDKARPDADQEKAEAQTKASSPSPGTDPRPDTGSRPEAKREPAPPAPAPEPTHASGTSNDERTADDNGKSRSRRRRRRGRSDKARQEAQRQEAPTAVEAAAEVAPTPKPTPTPEPIVAPTPATTPAPAPSQAQAPAPVQPATPPPPELPEPLSSGVVYIPDRAQDERKIAMFFDFENIALGVRDTKDMTFDVGLVLARLLEKGKIIVKRAYADWQRYAEFKRPLHEAAIEMIDIPKKRYSGKNSADIKMVVDAMDLCYAKEHLDTFVLVSGDSDFSPLVSKLKENDKYVIGLGMKGATSHLLVDNCDEFIYYEDVWRDAQQTPRLSHVDDKSSEVFQLIVEAMQALIREDKDVLWGSMIKQTMKRKRPSFNEGYYGYSTFSELLEDAEKKDVIRLRRDQRSGGYIVTGFASRQPAKR